MDIGALSIKEELELSKSILNSIPLSMFLLDKNKYIIGIYNMPESTITANSTDNIVGKHLNFFLTDSSAPFYDAFRLLEEAFDSVLATGEPIRFEYRIFDLFFEATASKLSEDKILCHVKDISDIIKKQQDIERKRSNELYVALTAGGVTSWNYDLESNLVTSSHNNEVTGDSIPLPNLLEKVLPAHRNILKKLYYNILEQGSEHEEITIQTYNERDELRWYNIHAVPNGCTKEGKVTNIIGSQKDITEDYLNTERLKKSEEENAKSNKLLWAVLNYMPCPLFIKDVSDNYKYILANRNLCEILNRPESAIIGHTDYDIFPKEEADKNRRDDSLAVSSSKKIEVEESVTLNGRKALLLNTKATFTSADNKTLLIGIGLDITDRQKAYEELKKAKKKAEQSDLLKSAFLANMSHEIRTPLNALVGFSQLISNTEDPDDREEYINIINSNSEILLNLINDILDLSKIESGYLECKNSEFNLESLFSELELTFSIKTKQNVKYIYNPQFKSCLVNLDKFRISQIITNFITNAIKFTYNGTIEAGYTVEQEGIKLYVKDTGIGLREEEIVKVFNRFEKFNPFEQGTGLGTSICKAIVDAYDGKIGVDSKLGQGSTFWAYIPTSVNTL